MRHSPNQTDARRNAKRVACVDCHWSGPMRDCDRKTVPRSRKGKDPTIHGYRPREERPRPPRPGIAPVCPGCGGWVEQVRA